MAAAMYQALPCFYSDYCEKPLHISFSNEFHETYLVTQEKCFSTQNSLCSLENGKLLSVLKETSFSQT